MVSCPELLFSCIVHYALTLRAGFHVPYPDMVAAALQAQPPYLTPVGRGDIGYDASHDDILNGLAVRARHGRNLLAEQPAPFIHLSLIAASLTAIFTFPSHISSFLPFDYAR